jgi:WD40 repeat protein
MLAYVVGLQHRKLLISIGIFLWIFNLTGCAPQTGSTGVPSLSAELIQLLENEVGGVLSLAWSPDGKQLVVGSTNPPVRIWSADSGEITNELHGPEGTVNQITWPPNGTYIAAASVGPTTTLWLWEAMNTEHLLNNVPLPDNATRVGWSPDGASLAVVVGGQEINLKEFDKQPQESSLTIYDAENWQSHANSRFDASISSVAWSPEGKRLAIGLAEESAGHEVLICDMDGSLSILARLKEEAYVTDIDWAPDGEQLAVGLFDGTVDFWNVSSGQHSKGLSHGGQVLSLAWSLGGEYLATGGDDNTAKLWYVPTGTELTSL